MSAFTASSLSNLQGYNHLLSGYHVANSMTWAQLILRIILESSIVTLDLAEEKMEVKRLEASITELYLELVLVIWLVFKTVSSCCLGWLVCHYVSQLALQSSCLSQPVLRLQIWATVLADVCFFEAESYFVVYASRVYFSFDFVKVKSHCSSGVSQEQLDGYGR